MNSRNTTRRNRHRLTIRAGMPDCFYCHQPVNYHAKHLDPESFAVDHKIPVVRAAEFGLSFAEVDSLENKVPAHRKCNADKGDMTADEYFVFLANGRQRPSKPAPAAALKPAVFRCGCSTQEAHTHADGAFYDHRPNAGGSFVTGRKWTPR